MAAISLVLAGVNWLSQSAPIERWQEQQAHSGACYFRGVDALASGDPTALDAAEADCAAR